MPRCRRRLTRNVLLRKRRDLFDVKRWDGSRDAGGKHARFLPMVDRGLLDAVTVLGGHDGGGETVEGDNEVMGDAEEALSVDGGCQGGTSPRSLNSYWNCFRIPIRGLTFRRTSWHGTWLSYLRR